VTCLLLRKFRSARQNFRLIAQLGVLIAALLLASAMALAAQTQAKPNPNPCNLSAHEADGLGRDLSLDVNAVRTYIDTVSVMLHQERFEQLDCLADRARANKERFPGGMWKIHEMYKGLDDPAPGKHSTEDDWHDLMQVLQRWVETHPKSVTARVATAGAWIGYAGAARGSGYSNTVSESGWKLYEERTARAEEILEKAAAMDVRCPEWYVVMINVAKNQSWDKNRLLGLFDEALAFEPGYYYYGRGVAMLLEPKWFGEEGDTEKFMQRVADNIGSEKGDAFYFHVASSNDIVCGCEHQPRLSLERIERGFEAVEKLYGASMLNLNRMAYLTIYAGKTDIPYGDKIFKRIGTEWDRATWDDQKSFEQARNWVSQLAPTIAKAQAKEEEARANVKTPEGAQYMLGFQKTYRDMFRDCAHSDGGTVMLWESKFDSLIQVGGNGSYEGGGMQLNGPLADCMNRKFTSSWQNKSPLFPVPPRPSYVVVIQMDLADFAPVAAEK